MNTIFTNANIYSMEAPHKPAEALWVSDGWVRGIGSREALLAEAGRCRVVDLSGGTVLPSFTDAHVHFLQYGLGLSQIDLQGRNREDTLAAVAAAVANTAAGRWIIGQGYDYNLWNSGWPQKQWLDAVSPGHPVALRAKDGHTVWVNQKALDALGIGEQTPVPKGGVIEQDDQGEPSGLFRETAVDLVWSQLPAPTLSQQREALLAAVAKMYTYGITAVHTMEDAFTWRAWQGLRRSGQPAFRGVLTVPAADLDAALAVGLQGGFGSEYLRFGGTKLFADGSLGSQTAWMLEPYEGRDDRGVIVTESAELEALIGRANGGGIPVFAHAIGDAANRAVLDAFARRGDRTLANRIEHAQLLDPADIHRLAALNIIASIQPTHCPMDREMGERHWGQRCQSIYPIRSLLQYGTKIAFGSDAPVECPDVLLGIYSAVTRRRWHDPTSQPWIAHERISILDAVQAYTVGAAAAVGEDAYRGRLTAGQRADFVVLSQDILAASFAPEGLQETTIDGVFFEGTCVYQR